MPVIEVQRVNKTITTNNSSLDILKNINFTLDKGEYVSIMGPSGSGKSTLLGILSCIDRQFSGYIKINNVGVSNLNEDKLAEFRNKSIGIVFQSFNLIPVLNAEENIEMPLFFSEKEIDPKKKVKELLEIVGLSDKGKLLPRQLSGGEQQRVAIARALAAEPKILFADEPTGALDSKNSEIVLDIFDKFKQNYDMTILMITHDIKVAKRADRIIKIEDGFLFEGNPEE